MFLLAEGIPRVKTKKDLFRIFAKCSDDYHRLFEIQCLNVRAKLSIGSSECTIKGLCKYVCDTFSLERLLVLRS